MKFYGGVPNGKINEWLKFDGDPEHHADSPIGNPVITQQCNLWSKGPKFWGSIPTAGHV